MKYLRMVFLLLLPLWANDWERVAVIISSSEGLQQDKTLRYAKRDGERLERTLRQVGMMEGKNIFHFHTESPKKLRTQLSRVSSYLQMKKEAGKKVFIQFYYSGHGSASGFHIGGEQVPLLEVRSWLGMQEMDAKLLVLDVCYGAAFFSKGFSTAKPIHLDLLLDEATEGEVIITSSAGDEQSFEAAALAGSVFTNNWIMALRGAGDLNGDGKVTLFESYNYSYDRTVAYSTGTLKRSQHPAFQMDLKGARDIPMSKPEKASGSSVVLKKARKGLYSISDEVEGILVGEFRVEKEDDFVLALQDGTYEILFDPRGKQPKKATITVRQNQVSLYANEFSSVSLVYAQAKGFKALQNSLALSHQKKYLQGGVRFLFGIGYKAFHNESLARAFRFGSLAGLKKGKESWEWYSQLYSFGVEKDLNAFFTVGTSFNLSKYDGEHSLSKKEFLQKPIDGFDRVEEYRVGQSRFSIRSWLSVLPWEWKGWRNGFQGQLGITKESLKIKKRSEQPIYDYSSVDDFERNGVGVFYSIGWQVQNQWKISERRHFPLQFYLGVFQSRATLGNNSSNSNFIEDIKSKETGVSFEMKVGFATGSWR